jgi:DNA-directed RNA polymerase subunit M/transcription elongation factor TFIIS
MTDHEAVYVFDCPSCGGFYGENALTSDNRLLCPKCYAEQSIPSPYVERMLTSYEVEPFTDHLRDCSHEWLVEARLTWCEYCGASETEVQNYLAKGEGE